jgi:hypothetical protein
VTIAYDTWDYWVFGLCPFFSIVKKTEEHNISETESLSIPQMKWCEKSILLGPLERANLSYGTNICQYNHSYIHLRHEVFRWEITGKCTIKSEMMHVQT